MAGGAYRGMMLSGVPNFAMTIGHTNASWTLKADLAAAYVCRLLNHVAAHGYRQCVPEPDPQGVIPGRSSTSPPGIYSAQSTSFPRRVPSDPGAAPA